MKLAQPKIPALLVVTKKLLGTSALRVVTGALLVVTKKLLETSALLVRMLLVAMPGAPSSVLSLLVAMPGAPSSFLVTKKLQRHTKSFLVATGETITKEASGY